MGALHAGALHATPLREKIDARLHLGGGSILRLNLNAVVVYGNPSAGDVMTTDKLYGIQFTEAAMEFKQGDKFMDVTIPFICLDIRFMAV